MSLITFYSTFHSFSTLWFWHLRVPNRCKRGGESTSNVQVVQNGKALARSNSNISLFCHLKGSVFVMSLLSVQSELRERISLMPAAIKHEISVFLFPLVSMFVQLLHKHPLATKSLFLGCISHSDPQQNAWFRVLPSFLVLFISIKPEESSLYFGERHIRAQTAACFLAWFPMELRLLLTISYCPLSWCSWNPLPVSAR